MRPLIIAYILVICTTCIPLYHASLAQPTHESASSSNWKADWKLCTNGTGKEPNFHCLCEEVNSRWRTCSSLCPVKDRCMYEGCQQFVEGCPPLTTPEAHVIPHPAIQGPTIPHPAVQGPTISQPVMPGSKTPLPVILGSTTPPPAIPGSNGSEPPPPKQTTSPDRVMLILKIVVPLGVALFFVILAIFIYRKTAMRREARKGRQGPQDCDEHGSPIAHPEENHDDLTEPDPSGVTPGYSQELLLLGDRGGASVV